MSSGFVSGGTIEQPAERDDEWRKAQEELEEKARRKFEETQQNDGKSLFEVLQANKAAKQEAFEEAARLKNQYRGLDDDEADFLDSVLESTRKQEATIQKETLDQLEAFRRKQEEVEKVPLEEQTAASPTEDELQWAVSGHKRKRGPENGLLKGVKLRKSSTSSDSKASTAKAVSGEGQSHNKGKENPVASNNSAKTGQPPAAKALPNATTSASPPAQSAKPALFGLDYGSSDED
ncbi:N-terminal domain of NEFA-interacting nuclear protein NIP30-domain-containing protein [Clohesyomyces aquaticus]|uniref:N-terminal domain of NEFA-interacting nuclear protein NIP30-domain-containing protein n=1 Tax=Clohesyomyces aquaticus TaxID=1231657 RepID=A0A1Y1ZNU8_9PLEO|nr:N-terminal domain of NEFA-interacting nuclear protein NIP30-domain-containing protein [Clohesyomyces aquaticus]